MRKQGFVFIILSLLITIATLHCKKEHDGSVEPAATSSGAIQGRVLNEYNDLLIGSVLNIKGNGINTSITTNNGNYLFDSIKAGSYNLSVQKDGYIEITSSITISAGDTITKDIVLKAGVAFLDMITDTIVRGPYSATFSIKISSNTSWTITNTSNWITPDKLNSNGEDSIVFTMAASHDDTVRQHIFNIQTGSIVKQIVVKQVPEVKLKQTIALPGNVETGKGDSIALVFNQPVTVKSIFPGYTLCQSGINYSYQGNKITFSYDCAALGGDYPFTVTTNNSLGDQYTFTFSIGFYEKIINLTGTIQSSIVNDSDNSYWIITDHPNALYKVDMTSFNILHKYDLPDEPSTFTISPYNNKIYLGYRGIPKLFILNQDGTTDQVIDIPHDTTRGIYEFNGPIIYPKMISFAKNGKGMIWLNDKYGNDFAYFWFIDASSDHRIWYEALPGYTGGYYLNPKANFDKTKLVLSSVNGDPTIGIFDAAGMTISSFRPSNYDIGGFVTPSRKNDNLYIGQLYFQLVANPATGFESLALNKDNRNGGNIDFCYKPGKDLTVYFAEGGYLQTIDYATGKTLMKQDAIYYLQGTTATLDGKYIILYRHDGNYNAKLIQLPASWLNE